MEEWGRGRDAEDDKGGSGGGEGGDGGKEGVSGEEFGIIDLTIIDQTNFFFDHDRSFDPICYDELFSYFN